MTTTVALELVSALVAGLFLVVGAAAVRRRGHPGAYSLAVVATLASIMGGLPVLSRLFPFGEGVLMGAVLLWQGVVVAWFAFAVAYTGRGPELTARTVGALVALPTASVAWSVVGQPRLEALGPAVVGLFGLAHFTLGVAGTIVVVRSERSGPDTRAGRTVALAAAGVAFVLLYAPLVLVTLSRPLRVAMLFGVLAVAGLALSGVLLTGALRTDPRTGYLARAALLDQMDAAVVVADTNGQILDLNAAGAAAFGLSRAAAFGRTVESVAGDPLDVSPGAGPTTRTLPTVNGERRFEVTATAPFGSADEASSVAYILRDVTERYTDEQIITALNRVLRHNLRNDLDAVRGFAEHLGEPDADTQRLAARVQGLAEDIADIGERVAETERVFALSSSGVRSVDVGELTRDVAASTLVDAPGSVSVDVATADPTVRTDPVVVRSVLRELITNALVHAGNDGGTVAVTVSEAPDSVSIAVADEGPGIPPRERDVLLDGDESPLRHGSGLGLWLVHIGAMRLGGDIDYREQDTGGAVVTLRVPDRGRFRPG